MSSEPNWQRLDTNECEPFQWPLNKSESGRSETLKDITKYFFKDTHVNKKMLERNVSIFFFPVRISA